MTSLSVPVVTSLPVPVGALSLRHFLSLYDITFCPRRSPVVASLPVPVGALCDITSCPCVTSLPVPVGALS